MTIQTGDGARLFVSQDQTHNTTMYLFDVGRGDKAAASQLFAHVYDELRALAARMMDGERRNHTLQPTALVHEAFVKLIDQTDIDWKNRAHFMAVAAQAIRRVLIDHARKHNAKKRGGDLQRITLMENIAVTPRKEIDLLAMDNALTRLSELSDRQARVVELRFFGGLTMEETAHVLDVSRSTVSDDWTVARAWLSRELSDGTSS